MSDGIWRGLSSWIYGASSFVSFLCEIAILVAITTVVRRHRPDAYRGLQLWAIGSLAVFVFLNVARLAIPVLARGSSGSMDGYFKMSSLLSMFGTGLHVALVALFIRGLITLAQPPKPVHVEGAPPYR